MPIQIISNVNNKTKLIAYADNVSNAQHISVLKV